jgi:protein Hikeshi
LGITRPSKTNPQWVYLGILTNEKPSAIFKLGGTKNQFKSADNLMEEDGPFLATSETIAQIGISVEPISSVLAMQTANTSSSNQLVLRSSVIDMPHTAMKLLESNVTLTRFL